MMCVFGWAIEKIEFEKKKNNSNSYTKECIRGTKWLPADMGVGISTHWPLGNFNEILNM